MVSVAQEEEQVAAARERGEYSIAQAAIFLLADAGIHLKSDLRTLLTCHETSYLINTCVESV